jgi:hypothetical protein
VNAACNACPPPEDSGVPSGDSSPE